MEAAASIIAAPDAATADARLMAQMRSWLWDPLKFCNDVFTRKPRDFQPEFIEAVRDNPRTAVKACRDAGKSAAAAYVFWWWLCTRPNSLVITTAPTGRQVKGALWTEIRSLWQNSLLPRIYSKWEVNTGAVVTPFPEWRAIGFSSDDPEKFEFGHAPYVLLIFDEAKLVQRGVYDSLQGLLTEEWRVVAISTPAGRIGWFYDAFKKDRDRWRTMSVSAAAIPRLSAWSKDLEEEYGADSPIYRRQVLAEFAGEEKGELIPLHFIEQCVDLGIPFRGNWKKFMSIDPAGQGSNETVVTYRWGPVILKQDHWSHRDEMETVGAVVKAAKGYNPDLIIVDKPGLGGPIISRLREVLDPFGTRQLVRAFNPGERARDEEAYENLKTEVAYYVRKLLRDKMISIPDDDELIKQLASYTVKPTSRGRDRIVDPPKSPDRADSLLMAFWPDMVRPGAVAGTIRGL
jgi:phage terminase large subunit